MQQSKDVVVEVIADPADAWYRVPNNVVREVGALDGYSPRTRMTLDNTYFAEGADFERFETAAGQAGVDLIQVPGGLDHDVAPVRYFGQFNADLVANPLEPGRAVTLRDGTEATVSGFDRDQITNQKMVMIEVPGEQGPETRCFPGTMVAQAVQPAPALNLTADARPQAPTLR